MIKLNLKGVKEPVSTENAGNGQFLNESRRYADHPIVGYVQLHRTEVNGLFRALNNSADGQGIHFRQRVR